MLDSRRDQVGGVDVPGYVPETPHFVREDEAIGSEDGRPDPGDLLAGLAKQVSMLGVAGGHSGIDVSNDELGEALDARVDPVKVEGDGVEAGLRGASARPIRGPGAEGPIDDPLEVVYLAADTGRKRQRGSRQSSMPSRSMAERRAGLAASSSTNSTTRFGTGSSRTPHAFQ